MLSSSSALGTCGPREMVASGPRLPSWCDSMRRATCRRLNFSIAPFCQLRLAFDTAGASMGRLPIHSEGCTHTGICPCRCVLRVVLARDEQTCGAQNACVTLCFPWVNGSDRNLCPRIRHQGTPTLCGGYP